MSDRDQLREMLQRLSVRHGEFTLVSGQKSNWYVDAKLTTCAAKAMPLVGRLFLDKFAENGWLPKAVGGLTMGADAIAVSVARESLERGLEVDAFVIRKETKTHGTKRFLEGIAHPDGVPVVILEDVCTTGGSTIAALERAREVGLEVMGVVCLVDREMGGEANIRKAFSCPFHRIFELSELTAGFDAAQ
jgi:orotate phosphoribosyltransferase